MTSVETAKLWLFFDGGEMFRKRRAVRSISPVKITFLTGTALATLKFFSEPLSNLNDAMTGLPTILTWYTSVRDYVIDRLFWILPNPDFTDLAKNMVAAILLLAGLLSTSRVEHSLTNGVKLWWPFYLVEWFVCFLTLVICMLAVLLPAISYRSNWQEYVLNNYYIAAFTFLPAIIILTFRTEPITNASLHRFSSWPYRRKPTLRQNPNSLRAWVQNIFSNVWRQLLQIGTTVIPLRDVGYAELVTVRRINKTGYILLILASLLSLTVAFVVLACAAMYHAKIMEQPDIVFLAMLVGFGCAYPPIRIIPAMLTTTKASAFSARLGFRREWFSFLITLVFVIINLALACVILVTASEIIITMIEKFAPHLLAREPAPKT